MKLWDLVDFKKLCEMDPLVWRWMILVLQNLLHIKRICWNGKCKHWVFCYRQTNIFIIWQFPLKVCVHTYISCTISSYYMEMKPLIMSETSRTTLHLIGNLTLIRLSDLTLSAVSTFIFIIGKTRVYYWIQSWLIPILTQYSWKWRLQITR